MYSHLGLERQLNDVIGRMVAQIWIENRYEENAQSNEKEADKRSQ